MAGRQYEMAFSIGAKVNGNFGAAFRSAAQQVQALQTTIDQLNKRQSDISSYERTANAIEKTSQKLALYQQQYANLKAEMDRNGQASAQEQNRLLAKGKAIDDQKEKLAQLQEKLRTTGDALQAEGVDLNNLSSASQNASDRIEALRKEQEELIESSDKVGDSTNAMAEGLMSVVAAVGAVEALKQIGEAFKECAEESIAFENSMASVKRTVGGNDTFIERLGDDFKQMSTEIPITTSELAQIASTAGQLGIAKKDVESFTLVMAKLATTTDLTADDAATMLAQFSNVTGVKEYDRLGSAVARLGDSTATTASKVVQMSQGMAASASIAGMKPTDILAIAAAVGSLGIEAQAGSTAMSTLINNMYKATETGEKLEDFSKVAGMSAEQFKKSWSEDAAGTLNDFIQGLNDTERNGKSAIVLLDELGINNVRQTKAILGLAAAGDLLTNTLAQSNEAWESNTALDEKAGIMYETTQAKITMLENSFGNLKVAVGDAFSGAIADGAVALNNLLQPMTDFIAANPAIVQGIGATVGVLGAATAALTGYTAVTKLASAASTAFAASTGVALGPVLAAVAGIAGLVGIITTLANAFGDTTMSMEDLDADFDNLTEKAREQQDIIDLCENYKKLADQVDHTVDVSKGLEDFDDIDIQLSAQADATLVPTDFLSGEGSDIILTAKSGEPIDASSLIVSGSENIQLNGEAGSQIEGDDLVSDKGVHLHADTDGIKLDADAFVNSKEIKFSASWANKAEMDASIESMKQAATDAKSELTQAKNALTDMQKHLPELQTQLAHAPTEMTKDSLKQQIEDLTTAIGQQEEKVGTLQTAYEQTAGQYLIAAQAAETLANHTNAIAEAEAALGLSAESNADAIQKETDAINARVDAKEREAKANLAAIRADIYANSGQQAKYYAQAVYDSADATREFAQAEKDAAVVNKYASSTAEEVNARYAYLLQSLNDMQNAGIPDKQRFTEFLDEANSLHNAMHGANFELQEIMDLSDGNKPDWVSNWGMTLSDEGWKNIVAEVNNDLVSTNERLAESEGYIDTYIQNMTDAVNSGALSLEEAQSLIDSHFESTENGAKIASDAFNRVKASYEEMQAAAKAAEEGMSAEEAQAQLQPIIDKIENLSKAYTDAYNAAYQSISGQFGLFEKMNLAQSSEDAQGAVDDMVDSLKSQSDYISQYMENLNTASEMGISEGLLKHLSDGSEQSAQILADIVAGGADKIDELNAEFAKVEEGKKKFADNIAEMQTEFSEKMAKYEQQLATTVAAMDKSGEAAAAASSTVSAFCSAASGKIGEVQSVFAQLSAAATIKASFSMPSISLGGMIGKLFGFAGGTPSAPPGYALVGEEGPELVKLRGGERILNADDTARAMDNSYESAEPVNAIQSAGTGNNVYTIDFKPQYNITGSMNADQLQAVLESHTQDMRSQIEDILDDIDNDRGRRRYA